MWCGAGTYCGSLFMLMRAGIIPALLGSASGLGVTQLLWSWLTLLGVYSVDATFTVLRRLLRGDKVYETHRSHAYQYASRRFGRHLPVTLVVGGINFLWLLPISLWVGLGGIDGLLGLLIAYVQLLVLAMKYHAGELERRT